MQAICMMRNGAVSVSPPMPRKKLLSHIRRTDLRHVVEAILYLATAGCQWWQTPYHDRYARTHHRSHHASCRYSGSDGSSLVATRIIRPPAILAGVSLTSSSQPSVSAAICCLRLAIFLQPSWPRFPHCVIMSFIFISSIHIIYSISI